MCADYGLQPGSSLDLTNGWDIKMEEHREEANRRMREESPPFTLFSNLQAMNPIHKSGDEQAREAREAYRQRIREAVQHMEFCCEIYREQLKAGRHFLHEHPWSAKSWWLRCVRVTARDPRAILVKTDLCRFGMQTTDEAGKLGPARKRTGFLTSSWALAEELAGTCEGQHRHNHLVERRAKGRLYIPARAVPSHRKRSRSTDI